MSILRSAELNGWEMVCNNAVCFRSHVRAIKNRIPSSPGFKYKALLLCCDQGKDPTSSVSYVDFTSTSCSRYLKTA